MSPRYVTRKLIESPERATGTGMDATKFKGEQHQSVAPSGLTWKYPTQYPALTDRANCCRPSGPARRAAHSLIEMLVVLIIVGVLIAIVVPAVQRARESARMAQCVHNQGQLAKAVHMHVADEPYGRFPGYRAFASDGTTVIGWAPQVFEYLGKSDQPADPNAATFIEVLTCPSDQGPTDKPRLNYVVNGGQAGTDSAADGIFFDHAKAEKVFITKDDFRDGLTNTIMLAENLDATEWNVTDEENQCILWPLTAGNEVNTGTGARPSSHHPGGFVAAFADGSVKFMTETDMNADPTIYVALLTPGGNDSDPIVSGDDDDDDSSGTPGCGSLNIQRIEIAQPYNVFHVAEVEVLERGSGTNVALGASATLDIRGNGSSVPNTPQSLAAPEAIDGDIATTATSPTASGGNISLLTIDLGGEYDVETIRVTNHSSNGGRLGGSGVYLYDGSGERVWSNVIWEAGNSSVHEFPVCDLNGNGSNCGLSGVYKNGTATRIDPSMALPFGCSEFSTGWVANMYHVGFNAPSGVTAPAGPVVWTGQIKADYDEDYTFWFVVDNDVQVYIDGTLTVIDSNHGGWGNNPGKVSHLTQGIAPISLAAGEWRDIEIHVNDRDEGHFWLLWESASTPRGNIPSCNLRPN